MPGIKVTETVTRFAKKLRRQLQTQTEQRANTVGHLVRASIHMEVKAFSRGLSTGRLAKSFRTRLERSPTRPTVHIESELPYARIHETGGIITGDMWIRQNRMTRGKRRFTPAKRVKIRRKMYLTKAAKRAAPRLRKLIAQTARVAVDRSR